MRAFSDLTKAWKTEEGATPKRNSADVHAIAAVVGRFDVVAVQEARGNLRAVRYLLKVLGQDWTFIPTDVTQGKAGNNERCRSRTPPPGEAAARTSRRAPAGI